jgi:hypothetical protein
MNSTLLPLSDSDRSKMKEAMTELLAHGSILGLGGKSSLYHWCRQNFEWLREIAALSGLDLSMIHEERMIQALPQEAGLQLRLKQDATLVWIALWYAADVCWRDEGQTQALMTVSELNALLRDQLLPDVIGPIARTRMKEILMQAERFNMIHFDKAEPFEDSGIEILPAIRRVMPFVNLKEWTETLNQYTTAGNDEELDLANDRVE